MSEEKRLSRSLERTSYAIVVLSVALISCSLLVIASVAGVFDGIYPSDVNAGRSEKLRLDSWKAPDISEAPRGERGDLIRYGRELIEHTAMYLGPKGKVRPISNGMNCQNCHLHGGTKPFGNNYALVASGYPRLRSRSGTVEGFAKRINDCINRSLNGQSLDTTSREMKAMVAYLKWVGKDVRKGEKPYGSGLVEIELLNRAADTVLGKAGYEKNCARCHGEDGKGLLSINGAEWQYPPLWGPDSYNTGAGLFRISKFAAFIKANMPYGITFEHPVLTDEECWDIAAFVNSKPRPHKEVRDDWPDISRKPMDHPFGPFADSFSEYQHKYGPFQPILEAMQN